MKILRKYLLVELGLPFVMILATLLTLLVLTQIVRLADLAIRKGVDISIILKIIVYSFPTMLPFALPMAVVTTLLLVLGRLSSDNEFLLVRASGVNPYLILIPILVVGVLMSLGTLILNDQIQPRAHFSIRRLIVQLGYQNPFAFIEPGEFIDDFNNHIIFVQSIEDKVLKNVIIYEIREGKEVRTIHAKEGRILPKQEGFGIVLALRDGFAEEPDQMDPTKTYTILFEECPVELSMDARSTSGGRIYKRLKELTIAEIKRHIISFKDKDLINRYKTELHRKISTSFAGFALMIMCIPLAIRTRHGEKSIGFALSILVLVAYYTLYFFSQSFAEAGVLRPWIIMWVPNTVSILAGFILFRRMLMR